MQSDCHHESPCAATPQPNAAMSFAPRIHTNLHEWTDAGIRAYWCAFVGNNGSAGNTFSRKACSEMVNKIREKKAGRALAISESLFGEINFTLGSGVKILISCAWWVDSFA
jgi:hypothetical protein